MSESGYTERSSVRYVLPGGNRIGPVTKALAILQLAGCFGCLLAGNFMVDFIMQRNAAVFPGRIWTLLTGIFPVPSLMSLLSALLLAFFLVRPVENSLKCRYLLLLLVSAVLAGSLVCFLTAPASPAPQLLFTLPGSAATGAMLHLFRGQRLRLFFVEVAYRTAIIIIMLLILLPFLLNGNVSAILGHLAAVGAGYGIIRLFEKMDQSGQPAAADLSRQHVRHLELD